jgi:hypothetical protein
LAQGGYRRFGEHSLPFSSGHSLIGSYGTSGAHLSSRRDSALHMSKLFETLYRRYDERFVIGAF